MLVTKILAAAFATTAVGFPPEFPQGFPPAIDTSQEHRVYMGTIYHRYNLNKPHMSIFQANVCVATAETDYVVRSIEVDLRGFCVVYSLDNCKGDCMYFNMSTRDVEPHDWRSIICLRTREHAAVVDWNTYKVPWCCD